MVLPALLLVAIWFVLAIGADKGANDLQEGAQASPGAESIALLAIDADPTGNTVDLPIDSAMGRRTPSRRRRAVSRQACPWPPGPRAGSWRDV